jgi:fructose/tagatose bisphosphate aldolase
MNIDTDLQFAFTEGIRDYMVKNIDYLRHKLVTLKVLMFQTKYYDQENGYVKAN